MSRRPSIGNSDSALTAENNSSSLDPQSDAPSPDNQPLLSGDSRPHEFGGQATPPSTVDRFHTSTARVNKLYWHLYTWSCISAVGLDLLYQLFLGQSIVSAVGTVGKNLVEELGGDPNSEHLAAALKAISIIIAVPTVGANAIADLTAVDPIQDAHDVMTSAKTMEDLMLDKIPNNHPKIGSIVQSLGKTTADKLAVKSAKRQILHEEFSWMQRHAPSAFYRFHQIFIVLLNYIPLASADGIAIANLGSSPSLPVVWAFTGIAGFLGTLYYHLLTDRKLQKTSLEFCWRLFSWGDIKLPFFSKERLIKAWDESMIVQAAKNPMMSLQAGFEIVSNAFYRGIAASYMAYTLLPILFGEGNYSVPVILPGIVTAWTTVFSRSLPAIEKAFAQPKKEQGVILNIKEAKPTPTVTTIADTFLTLNRAIAATYILYSSAFSQKEKTAVIRLVIPGLVFLGVTAHGVYASTTINRNHAIIAAQEAAEKRAAEEKGKQQDLVGDNPAPVVPAYDKMTSAELFEELRKEVKPGLEKWLNVMNGLSRSARQVAFVGFVNALLNEFLSEDLNIDLGLRASAIIAIAQLFGMEIAINDYRFYGPGYVESWANHVVKYQIHTYGKTTGWDSGTRHSIRLLDGVKMDNRAFASSDDYHPEDLAEIVKSHHFPAV